MDATDLFGGGSAADELRTWRRDAFRFILSTSCSFVLKLPFQPPSPSSSPHTLKYPHIVHPRTTRGARFASTVRGPAGRTFPAGADSIQPTAPSTPVHLYPWTFSTSFTRTAPHRLAPSSAMTTSRTAPSAPKPLLGGQTWCATSVFTPRIGASKGSSPLRRRRASLIVPLSQPVRLRVAQWLRPDVHPEECSYSTHESSVSLDSLI